MGLPVVAKSNQLPDAVAEYYVVTHMSAFILHVQSI